MPPTITLYSFAPSHNAVRPEIALLEKGLAFDKVSVNLLEGEHKKPPLSEITPRGQVPTLVYQTGDEPVVVYESIAIIRFIEDMHPDPPLMPPTSDPHARARANMRISEFQAKLDPKNIFGSVAFRRQDREQLGGRFDDLVAELPRWNEYLDGRDYMADAAFGLADIAVFPLLLHFEALGYAYATHTPALAAYIERCKERPSVRQTGWVDTFGKFVKTLDPAPVLAKI